MRILAAHVFQNTDVTLANVGPLGVGQPLWRNHREWTVSEFPRGHAFSHVIDPLELTRKRRAFLSHVMKHDEWLDRYEPPPAEAGGQTPDDPVRGLVVLPRRDIEVVLFVTEIDLAHVAAMEASLKILPTAENPNLLVVTNGSAEQRLYGVVLPHYIVLPVADFSNPYVFLIRERTLPPPFGFFMPRGQESANTPAPETPANVPAQNPTTDDAAEPTAP